MKKIILFFVFFLALCELQAQIEYKKYPMIVVNNSENEVSPCLSMDGNTLLFARKRVMEEDWMVQISKKNGGQWQRPSDLSVLNKLPKLRLLGSYSLNTNGSAILFVSKKSGGLGSYDIWLTKLNGTNWTEPENLGNPLNSKLDELSPCFSLDNKMVYFIRKGHAEENGKVYTSFKKGDLWATPTEVVLHNTFVSLRIAADNETMYLTKIIAGKTHLFFSKKKNETWSTPQEIKDFDANCGKFFALDAQSNQLTVSLKKETSTDLYTIKLPVPFSAKTVSVLNYSNTVDSKVTICEKLSGLEVYKGRELKEFYLKNDKEYLLLFTFKDFLPHIMDVNLLNSPSSKKSLVPKQVKIGGNETYIIKEYDKGYLPQNDILYLKKYLELLNQTAIENPNVVFEFTVFISDPIEDSLKTSVYEVNEGYILEDLKKSMFGKLASNLKINKTYLKPKNALKERGYFIRSVI